MSTLTSHPRRPGGRLVQKANGVDDEPVCPYCGASLTRKEFVEIRARVEAEERARIDDMEQSLNTRFARHQQQLAAKAQTEIEKARREAAAQVAKAKRDSAARAGAIRQEATRAATAALAPKIAEAVSAEKAKAYSEKLKLTEQLQDMQRRLEKKTAGDLGDEAELDLYEALKREFSLDQIARVPRGRTGADILFDVVHSGTVVGRVIFDSKNHSRWQNKFTSKLRLDMIDHKADHGVLSSSVFPAGARQLHIQDGVIVAAPARVIMLAHLLRRQIVQLHAQRQVNAHHEEKRDQLYEFIASDRCTQLLDQIGSLTGAISELDAKERSNHSTVWNRRAELIRAIHAAQNEVSSEIQRIIDGTVMEPSS